MKKIIIVTTCVLLTSCSFMNQPKCADEDVKLVANQILTEQLQDEIVEQYIRDNYSYSDSYQYASDNRIDAQKYTDTEREKVKKAGLNYAKTLLSKSKIINIRTNKIEEEIKKCSCSAEIENKDLNQIEIDYTAQYPEDSDEKVYVELSYKMK